MVEEKNVNRVGRLDHSWTSGDGLSPGVSARAISNPRPFSHPHPLSHSQPAPHTHADADALSHFDRDMDANRD